MTAGSWLKQERERHKVSLEEIAAVTRVHIGQLQAIEDNRWSDLPAPAFVRGFLVSYARHLSLNEDDILEKYRKTFGPSHKTLDPSSPKGVHSDSGSGSQPRIRVVNAPGLSKAPQTRDLEAKKMNWASPKILSSVSGIIAVVVLLSWLISVGKTARKNNPTNEETVSTDAGSTATVASPALAASAPVTASTAPATNTPPTLNAPAASAVTTSPSLVPSAPQASSQAAASALVLELHGIEQSWVNAKIDNASSKGFLLAAGGTSTLDIKTRVQLVLSNAGAVELKWNGKWYQAPGFRGDVKQITLPDDIAMLKEKSAPIPQKRSIPARTDTAPAATPTAAPTVAPSATESSPAGAE